MQYLAADNESEDELSVSSVDFDESSGAHAYPTMAHRSVRQSFDIAEGDYNACQKFAKVTPTVPASCLWNGDEDLTGQNIHF